MKEDNQSTTEKKSRKEPVKVICQSVYVGEKSMSEIFFDIIYNEITKKPA